MDITFINHCRQQESAMLYWCGELTVQRSSQIKYKLFSCHFHHQQEYRIKIKNS